MPTELGPEYKLDWRGIPPHMLKPDVPVWYRFLEKWGFLFLKLWYDVQVGGQRLTEEEKRDPMKRMWRANTVKRIDALAELENEVWIIEVAYESGLRSLGQVETYTTLWSRDPVIPKPTKALLVSQMIDPDFLDAAAAHGVQVYLV